MLREEMMQRDFLQGICM